MRRLTNGADNGPAILLCVKLGPSLCPRQIPAYNSLRKKMPWAPAGSAGLLRNRSPPSVHFCCFSDSTFLLLPCTHLLAHPCSRAPAAFPSAPTDYMSTWPLSFERRGSPCTGIHTQGTILFGAFQLTRRSETAGVCACEAEADVSRKPSPGPSEIRGTEEVTGAHVPLKTSGASADSVHCPLTKTPAATEQNG